MADVTVVKIATAQAQGIANEYLYQKDDTPESDWAYTILQGGAWALAVLYADYTGDGIAPDDLIHALELERAMTHSERRALVEELFNE